MLTETKLDDKATTSLISLNHDGINILDRNSNGGGIVTYIKNSLKPVFHFELQDRFKTRDIETTVSSVSIASADKSRSNLVIIGAYRPPNADSPWFTTLNELVLETIPLSDPPPPVKKKKKKKSAYWAT